MSKWNFDKLFADKNIVGIKNEYTGEVFPWLVDTLEESQNNLYNNLMQLYANDKLKYHSDCVCDEGKEYATDFTIQYIISLNNDGTIKEHIFSRERDMPNPMPELKTGMFIVLTVDGDKEFTGVIIGNSIVYKDGEYDKVNDVLRLEDDTDYISKVYAPTGEGFDNLIDYSPIWVNTEYNKGEN